MELAAADGWFAVWKREGEEEPHVTRIAAWLVLDKSSNVPSQSGVVGLYADEYGVTIVMTDSPTFRGYVRGGDPCPLSFDGDGQRGRRRWHEYYTRQQERRLEYDGKRILGDEG